MVTSNHIHPLLYDIGERECIPRTIQLIAGRTGQEFNQRKYRKGAFWEDRYHATAVESGEHLIQCLVYLDSNMIRAGAVGHPSEWGQFGGYNEIQSPRKRYSLINHKQLAILVGKEGVESLITSHAYWVEEALEQETKMRDAKRSGSIAVGSKEFIENTKEELGQLFLSVKAVGEGEQYELHDPQAPYHSCFTPKIDMEDTMNAYKWQ